jgi:hypothetical protein
VGNCRDGWCIFGLQLYFCGGIFQCSYKAITSPTDFHVDDYTNDDLILSGRTVDVIRNETNNHLRHLTHFLKRTFNTNVIILNVLHCFGPVNVMCEQRNRCI